MYFETGCYPVSKYAAFRTVGSRRPALVLVVGLLVGASALEGSDSFLHPAAGFVGREAVDLGPRPGGVGAGGVAVTPSGTAVTYAEGAVQVHEASGPRTIAVFDPPVYGSFVVLEPEGDAVFFGESSSWNIWRVPLSGSGAVLRDRMQNAFDLAFGPDGRGYMSALTNEPANEIALLDADPEARNPTVVTNIPGVSGPLTFDADGNLWYVMVAYSDEGLHYSLSRFARAQIETAVAGPPIDFVEGETILDGFDGFYDLQWHDGRLWGTDLGFLSGAGGVVSIDPGENYAQSLLVGFENQAPFLSPSWLCFRPGERPFVPGNGAKGGSVFVVYSDYSTTLGVAEVSPELHFIRGEVTSDEIVDISDAISILGYLFLGEAGPADIEAADTNSDRDVDLSDAVYVLNFLFSGGPIIPLPYPERGPALQ